MSQDLLARLYGAFDPLKPLPAADPAYVDCREVRADGEILVSLGRQIVRSTDQHRCLLYSGLQGVGKSTELLRLRADLEEQGYRVIYIIADQADIDPKDTHYIDILLMCVRHVVGQLNSVPASQNPLLQWLKGRWFELKTLVQTDAEFEELTVEDQLSQFSQLTSNIQAVPSLRDEIRRQVNPYTVTLLNALNDYLKQARPDDCEGIVIIIDNLNRIMSVSTGGKTNIDSIFVGQAEQLKRLACHIVYTVPIAWVYSRPGTLLEDLYGKPHMLPMIMTHSPDDKVYWPGLEAMKSVVAHRISRVNPVWVIDQERLIFEAGEILERICLMSGGHLKILMQLVQLALERSTALPVQATAVQRALTEMRDTYRRTIETEQWSLLVTIAQTKQCLNQDVFNYLLQNRCVLEYHYLDEEDELRTWYDVHPLIRGIPDFKSLLHHPPLLEINQA